MPTARRCFYIVTYVMTTLASFGIILLLGARRASKAKRSPTWPA
jgi:hypothetical protein